MKAQLLFVGLVSLAVACGCSGGKNPNAPASVHGKVTYNGQPVTGGTLTIHAPGIGARYSLSIGADGTYAGTDLPAGDCVVTVDTESLNPAKVRKQPAAYGGKNDPMQDYSKKMAERMGKQPAAETTEKQPAGVYVKIPARYADAEKSPLRVELDSGDQKKDIALTD
jgi:hypothetical protein